MSVTAAQRELASLAGELDQDVDGEVVGVIDGRLLIAVTPATDVDGCDGTADTAGVPARVPVDDATSRTVAQPPGVAENVTARNGEAAASVGSPLVDAPAAEPLDDAALASAAHQVAEDAFAEQFSLTNLTGALPGGTVLPSGFTAALVELAAAVVVPVATVHELPVFALTGHAEQITTALAPDVATPPAPSPLRDRVLEEILDAALDRRITQTRARTLVAGARRRRRRLVDLPFDALVQLRDNLRHTSERSA